MRIAVHKLDKGVEKKIGIFGSAFDPPHFGHVAVIVTAIQTHGFDEVWLSCSLDRWDKTCSHSFETRHKWAQILADELYLRGHSVSCLSADTMQHERFGTYEFLKHLECPEHRLTLILGADSYAKIYDWYNPRVQNNKGGVQPTLRNGHLLCDEFQILVSARLGHPKPQLLRAHHALLPQWCPKTIRYQTGYGMDFVAQLSSTAIRNGLNTNFCYSSIET